MKRARFNETLNGDLAMVIFSMLKDDPVAIGCARLVCKDWHALIPPPSLKNIQLLVCVVPLVPIPIMRLIMKRSYPWNVWRSLINFAVEHDYADMLRLIFEKGVHHRTDDDFRMIVFYAIVCGSLSILDLMYAYLLLKVDRYFGYAICNGHVNSINWFIETAKLIDPHTYKIIESAATYHATNAARVAALRRHGMNNDFWGNWQMKLLYESPTMLPVLVALTGSVCPLVCASVTTNRGEKAFKQAREDAHDAVRHVCGCEVRKKKRAKK